MLTVKTYKVKAINDWRYVTYSLVINWIIRWAVE